MNDRRVIARTCELRHAEVNSVNNRPRRLEEARLTLEIIQCAMVGLLLLVSVLGVGGMLTLGHCTVGWIAIITGAEIARRVIKLNYLNTRR